MIALDTDIADHMHFKRIAGNVILIPGGKPIHQSRKQDISPSDAKFVVDYCINTILNIENRVGDLDAPFGAVPQH